MISSQHRSRASHRVLESSTYSVRAVFSRSDCASFPTEILAIEEDSTSARMPARAAQKRPIEADVLPVEAHPTHSKPFCFATAERGGHARIFERSRVGLAPRCPA